MNSKEARYYSDIVEVTECDWNTANELLKKGWEILVIKDIQQKSIVGEQVIQESKIVYVMGRKGEVIEEKKEEDAFALDLDKLPWKKYPRGPGAWIWTEPEGHYEDEVCVIIYKLADRLSKAKAQGKKSIKIGNYEYRYSGPEDNQEMFISRKPIK